jgi:hypothetical protein
MNYEKRGTIIVGFLTLIVLLIQALIFFNQTNIMQTQTDILDKTTQSNKADLTLVSSQGDIAYELSEIDETKESESLAIGVVNYGKSIAPFVKIRLKPDIFRAIGEYQYGWDVRELKSLGDNSTFFRISLNGNQQLLPKEYNLTFSIDCPYCETPYKEENVSICIRSGYQEMVEECGERWASKMN